MCEKCSPNNHAFTKEPSSHWCFHERKRDSFEKPTNQQKMDVTSMTTNDMFAEANSSYLSSNQKDEINRIYSLMMTKNAELHQASQKILELKNELELLDDYLRSGILTIRNEPINKMTREVENLDKEIETLNSSRNQYKTKTTKKDFDDKMRTLSQQKRVLQEELIRLRVNKQQVLNYNQHGEHVTERFGAMRLESN